MAVQITSSGFISNDGFRIADLGTGQFNSSDNINFIDSPPTTITRISDGQFVNLPVRTRDHYNFPLLGSRWNGGILGTSASRSTTSFIRYYENRIILDGDQTVTVTDAFNIDTLSIGVEFFYYEILATYFTTANQFSQAYSVTYSGAWEKDSAGFTALSVGGLGAYDIVPNSTLDSNNITFNGGGATVPSITVRRSDTAVSSGGKTIWNISGFTVLMSA
jgi:hypothetical protein